MKVTKTITVEMTEHEYNVIRDALMVAEEQSSRSANDAQEYNYTHDEFEAVANALEGR